MRNELGCTYRKISGTWMTIGPKTGRGIVKQGARAATKASNAHI